MRGPFVPGGRTITAAAFVIALALQSAYVLWRGVRVGPDAAVYSMWGDLLIAGGFDYGAFLERAESVFPPRLYLGFVTWVAVCKLAFGSGWGHAIIAGNVLAMSLVAPVLTWIALQMTGSRVAACAALAFYLLSVDFVLWPSFVATDTVFVLFVTIVFAGLARAILTERHAKRALLAVVAVASVAVVYRPTGVLLLPGIALALAIWGMRRRAVHLVETRPAALMYASMALGASAVAAAVGHAWIMQDPARWPVQAGASIMRFNAAHYRMGEVVWDRPETFHSPPTALTDFLLITGDRFFHFWAFALDAFSVAHNLVGTLAFAPLYLCAAVGLAQCLRRSSRLDPRVRLVGFLAGAMILTFATFHALVQVDYDWRYRIPVVPLLIALAAPGAAHVLERVARRRTALDELAQRQEPMAMGVAEPDAPLA